MRSIQLSQFTISISWGYYILPEYYLTIPQYSNLFFFFLFFFGKKPHLVLNFRAQFHFGPHRTSCVNLVPDFLYHCNVAHAINQLIENADIVIDFLCVSFLPNIFSCVPTHESLLPQIVGNGSSQAKDIPKVTSLSFSLSLSQQQERKTISSLIT